MIKRILYTFFVILAVLVFLVGVAVWWFWDEPLLSPVSSQSAFRFLLDLAPKRTRPSMVYGFLPYWNVNKVTLQPEVTNIGYFGLGIGADGSLQTRSGGNYTPGYTALQSEKILDLASELESRGGTMELVLTQFSGGDIEAFLNSETAQANFMDMLDAVILSYPISGVNIDIEPSGIEITPALRTKMTTFMANLRHHLNSRYDHIPLSIDMYASASNNEQIWDVPALADQVDFIVVMAYDYHRRSSPQAGPVAPIFGGDSVWSSDINQHLQAFLRYAPADKYVLGIPFYGYEWQTTDEGAQSNTFPETGATATLSRVSELLARKDELQVKEYWNEHALSPYLSYVEAGKTYIVYYENPRSIAYKLDLVNELGLHGIAIWALGYESSDRALWDVIKTKL